MVSGRLPTTAVTHNPTHSIFQLFFNPHSLSIAAAAKKLIHSSILLIPRCELPSNRFRTAAAVDPSPQRRRSSEAEFYLLRWKRKKKSYVVAEGLMKDACKTSLKLEKVLKETLASTKYESVSSLKSLFHKHNLLFHLNLSFIKMPLHMEIDLAFRATVPIISHFPKLDI
ncbi:hypothetical protein Fot_56777 [Forsythia ovata]|uniref:Uncharacterized protein n=1 Tax=Forsythia ovata TaxID=205694 RepID=A0ABD1NYA7_9LAMI